jgi:peptidoglycan/LPS O-acetylase OafA/YrhL
LNKNNIYEIETLRIFGAVSVLLYHYTFRGVLLNGTKVPLFPIIGTFSRYGYLGVNLFFMISGFVILLSALNKSPLNFAISRMDRLYPTYWVSVTLTTVIVIILTNNSIPTRQYLVNLTMIQDYFDIQSIDGVYWTLSVELKFYFSIFLLILTKQIDKYHIWIPVWLATTIIYLIFSQPFFMGWFISPFYSSYFISGILFYLIYARGITWQKISVLIISMSISIYYTIFQVDGFIKVPTLIDRIIAPIIVISFYALFYLICSKKLIIKGSKILLICGGVTYPIYLLHARIGKTFYDLMSQGLNKYFVLITTILFILILSFVVRTIVSQVLNGHIRKLALSVVPNKFQ